MSRQSGPQSRLLPLTGRSAAPAPPARDLGQIPLLGRIFPAPLAAKVPEVILLFWVVKILTTAGGEAASDYLKTWGNIKGGGAEVALFVAGLLFQFGTRRYRAFAYWFLAYAIAIFGTGVSDFLHLDVHIPYLGTTLLWAAILAVIFWAWQRQRRHSLYPQHHNATARSVLLGDRVRHLRPGHRARGLHRRVAQPRLPGLRHLLRGTHLAARSRLVAIWPQCRRRLLDVVRGDPTAWGIIRRLHQQALAHEWPRLW